MGATDEVHLRTETRGLLKKERKKSLASVRFSKQITISVQGMLDAVTPSETTEVRLAPRNVTQKQNTTRS